MENTSIHIESNLIGQAVEIDSALGGGRGHIRAVMARDGWLNVHTKIHDPPAIYVAVEYVTDSDCPGAFRIHSLCHLRTIVLPE